MGAKACLRPGTNDITSLSSVSGFWGLQWLASGPCTSYVQDVQEGDGLLMCDVGIGET